MKAIVVEGGAMRGVFATGVLDKFLEESFDPFDFHLGVSAGASNLAAYLAEMPQRNYKIYTDYALRPEFINIVRFIKGGHLMDLDWLWGITIDELRLDLPRIHRDKGPLYVVMTNVASGAAVYQQTSIENTEDMLLASSALPWLYRRFPGIDGQPMTDGGVADALPVQAAIDKGARRIMVVRSRPQSYVKKKDLMSHLLGWKFRQFPNLKSLLLSRTERYNRSLELIRNPPAGVDIIEVCPPENLRGSRIGKNVNHLKLSYQLGLDSGSSAISRWSTN